MDLEKIRKNIDRVDAEILQLMTRRMEYAVRTKRFKTEVTDPSREEQVLAKARERAKGLLGSDFGEDLFKVILGESRRLQNLQIPLAAFQGEHGSYGEVALNHYHKDWVGIPCRELSEIFEAVLSGGVDYGVVPIENSLEGSESEVQDLLIDSPLHVVGEIRIPIRHCLLTLKETDYREIKDVFSNPATLSQCRGFLKRNKLEAKPYYDSAGAALMLLRERPTAAAVIGSPLCAKLYDLEILKEGIQDTESSFTRYLILSKTPGKEEGDRCSIVFTTPHRAGALIEVLKLFSDAGINLTKIESRPLRKDPSKAAFLLEFAGSDKDAKVQKTLAELSAHTTGHRLLGCYRETIIS